MNVRSGYKQTELGEIPEDWNVLPLSRVFRLTNGKPMTQKVVPEPTGNMVYPVYGANGMIGFGDSFLTESETLVIGRVGEYCGSIHYAPQRSWITDNALFVLQIVKSGISLHFLKYLLSFLKLNKYKARSGQPLLTQTLVNSIVAIFPPLREQHKIASILSNVDASIQKSDQIITKTQQLKRGLSQQLLTRGIGHTSFKQTAIGEVPTSWNVKKLEEIVISKQGIKRGPWGGSIKKDIFVKTGYKIYEQQNVILNDFSIGNYFINKSKFEELKEFAVQEEDLLLTAAGTMGKLAVVPENSAAGIINQALIRIRLDSNVISNSFFKNLFEFYVSQGLLSRYSHGAALKNLASTAALKSINIAIPSVEEQQKIAYILLNLDKKIEKDTQVKEVLERLKKGLMNDLLTGKVRASDIGTGGVDVLYRSRRR